MDLIAIALKSVELCMHHFLAAHSEDEAEYTLPASSVISSQIPGYDGREVDTNETVEVTFPIHVRKHALAHHTNACCHIIVIAMRLLFKVK